MVEQKELISMSLFRFFKDHFIYFHFVASLDKNEENEKSEFSKLYNITKKKFPKRSFFFLNYKLDGIKEKQNIILLEPNFYKEPFFSFYKNGTSFEFSNSCLNKEDLILFLFLFQLYKEKKYFRESFNDKNLPVLTLEKNKNVYCYEFNKQFYEDQKEIKEMFGKEIESIVKNPNQILEILDLSKITKEIAERQKEKEIEEIKKIEKEIKEIEKKIEKEIEEEKERQKEIEEETKFFENVIKNLWKSEQLSQKLIPEPLETEMSEETKNRMKALENEKLIINKLISEIDEERELDEERDLDEENRMEERELDKENRMEEKKLFFEEGVSSTFSMENATNEEEHRKVIIEYLKQLQVFDEKRLEEIEVELKESEKILSELKETDLIKILEFFRSKELKENNLQEKILEFFGSKELKENNLQEKILKIFELSRKNQPLEINLKRDNEKDKDKKETRLSFFYKIKEFLKKIIINRYFFIFIIIFFFILFILSYNKKKN